MGFPAADCPARAAERQAGSTSEVVTPAKRPQGARAGIYGWAWRRAGPRPRIALARARLSGVTIGGGSDNKSRWRPLVRLPQKRASPPGEGQGLHVGVALHGLDDAFLVDEAGEIGSAACRDRLVQYV